jgi:uncharacterized protein (DUF302 family)
MWGVTNTAERKLMPAFIFRFDLFTSFTLKEIIMFRLSPLLSSYVAACVIGVFGAAATYAATAMQPVNSAASAIDSGIVKVKSKYTFAETVTRLKQDVASKGIKFFDEIDQTQLAANAGVKLRPSTLLVFGNPPLGTLFINANPLAGLDWPVRLLVLQDESGEVWATYTDFAYIARRHNIQGKDLESFKTASGVITSITSSVTK